MTNILGVTSSNYRSHDNAACILKDGKLVAAVEEERLSRKKHAYDTAPIRAVRFCLEQAGLKLEDIDAVAVGWDLPRLNIEKKSPKDHPLSDVSVLEELFPESDFGTTRPPMHFIPHHRAHAATSAYSSGFDRSAVMVIDGAGETDASSHWHFSNKELSPIASWNQDPHSLGFLFEATSEYLHLPQDSAGIVMGLAAYGMDQAQALSVLKLTSDGYEIDLPKAILDQVEGTFANRDNYYLQERIVAQWKAVLEEKFGPQERIPKGGDPTQDIRKVVAATVQKTFQEALLHSARVLRSKTGEDRLCLSGGAALNCSANGALQQAGIFKEVYIYPASNDAGVAIGAAFEVNQCLGDSPLMADDTPYLGPEFSDQDIREALSIAQLNFRRCHAEGGDFDLVAEQLEKGAVIGWFQGRAEIGPRALGARSILARPDSVSIRDRVNDIKQRERWRPLTPSILEGDEGRFFQGAVNSPFMLKAFPVRAEIAGLIPGVVHVDGSCRYQSVCPKTNPPYWQLIKSFRKRTGLPMVMNTSFNDRGEPIVCTPEDAIRTFQNRPLDGLAIGDYWVQKKP